MARKVVVVDDEKPIADILEFNLKRRLRRILRL